MCDVQRPASQGELRWYKSSYSGGSGQGSCVQTAVTTTGMMMRDSKDPDGTTHRFDTTNWRIFIAQVRAGEYRLS